MYRHEILRAAWMITAAVLVMLCSPTAHADSETTSSLLVSRGITTTTMEIVLNTTGAKEGLLSKVEARLGRPLTYVEKNAVMLAGREQGKEMNRLQVEFAQLVSRVTDVPQGEVTFMLPVIGSANDDFDKIIAPKLETRLKRKLTESQLATLRDAQKVKKEAMEPVRQKFTEELARLTGLSSATIADILPKSGT